MNSTDKVAAKTDSWALQAGLKQVAEALVWHSSESSQRIAYLQEHIGTLTNSHAKFLLEQIKKCLDDDMTMVRYALMVL